MNPPSFTSFIQDTLQVAGSELAKRFGQSNRIQIKKDRSLVTDADLASESIIISGIKKFYPDHIIYSEESGLSSKNREEGQYMWIIDPLDGTTNFANGYPFFCISIALAIVTADKKLRVIEAGIQEPLKQDCFSASLGKGSLLNGNPIQVHSKRTLEHSFLVTGFYYKNGETLTREVNRFAKVADRCPSIRRDGAAALDLALVAAGTYDAFWEHGLQPWDLAAGSLLVTESGGSICNYGVRKSSEYDLEGQGVIAGTRSVVDELVELLA